jgi:3-oxoacyl-[acyl-carrier-protein] synthase II
MREELRLQHQRAPGEILPETVACGARRVLVTGLGAVTPFGASLAESVRRMGASTCVLAPTRALDGRPRLAGSIADLEPRRWFRAPKALKLSDRKTQLGVAAATMALADAGFPESEQARAELGVLFACAATDLEVDRLAAAVGPDPARRAVTDIPYFAERVLRRLYPLWLLVNLPNMLAAQIGIQISSTGPNHTLLTEWIAGAQAIGEAFLMIRSGELDAAVAGGAESPLSPVYAGCLDRQGLGGLVLAEAAAALVLEAPSCDAPRGVPERPAIAEVTGYATASPADAATLEHAPPAIIRAARAALAMHAPSDEDTQHVDTPGLGAGDSPWWVLGFGPPGVDPGVLAAELPSPAPRVVRLQELMGHPLGAAGAVATVLGIALARSEASAPASLLCATLGYTGLACALTLRVFPAHGHAALPEAAP